MLFISEPDVIVAIIFSTFIILLLTIVVILVATVSHRRRLKQSAEMVSLKLSMEQQHSAAIIQMLEEERVRIGQNLHDDLGSRLSINKLMLEDLLLNLASRTEAEIMETLTQVSQANKQSIDDLRAISRELAASRIQTIGLNKALSGKIEECNRAGTVHFSIQSLGPAIRLPALQEMTIYRIVCELLNNVLKHAEATEATLDLDVQPRKLVIVVKDNGKGLAKGKTTGDGIGLHNIRHRINYLKGAFNIEANPQGGTVARLEIPLQA